MNADFETAAWARHHAALRTEVNKVLRVVAIGLAALNRREFDAPWRREARVRRVA